MNMEKLFTDIASKYCDDNSLIEKLWTEIQESYSKSNRYYHNLLHIENVINEISLVKEKINDWDTILFSAFYHDIIYDVKSPSNEEDSAEFARNRLLHISYPLDKISVCISQILATKGHSLSDNTDTNYLVDADLSVLGKEWNVYSSYSQQVRQEYSIYPDLLYNQGRTKVLETFLSKDKIYKTDYFFRIYEEKSRMNIAREINIINETKNRINT